MREARFFGGDECGRQTAVAFNAGQGSAATMNGQAAGGGGNECGGAAAVDERSAAAMSGNDVPHKGRGKTN